MATIILSKKVARTLSKRFPPQTGAALAEAAGKEHKYHAETDREALMMDGHKFDSLAEMARYGELKMLSSAGFICGLLVHPKYPIKISGYYICDVELDFEYFDSNDDAIYEDVKGADTALSRLKRKLVEAVWEIKVTVIR